MGLFDGFTKLFGRDKAVSKTKVHGRGTNYGVGYSMVDIEETNQDLRGTDRYKKFKSIAYNNPAIAASLRHYYANLTEPDAHVEATDDSSDSKRYAEEIEQQIEQMDRPFRRTVRTQAGHEWMGFALQEWQFVKRNGLWVVKNLHPRPQDTILDWIGDHKTSELLGVIQQDNLTGEHYRIPRAKLVYTVDDTLTDLPNGTGLLRHLCELSDIRKKYVGLEGEGFEMDMQGIPVFKYPMRRLMELKEKGKITKTQFDNLLKPVKAFISARSERRRIRGVSMDSEPHVFNGGPTEGVVATNVPTFSAELLQADVKTMADLKSAIARIDFEISRVAGTQMLMLGETRGTQALSEDISKNLALRIDGVLSDIGEAYRNDLFKQICVANGWDIDKAPYLKFDSTQYRDIKEITEALGNVAQFMNVLLGPDDPAVGELFDMLGLSRPRFEHIMKVEDFGLMDNGQASSDDKPSKSSNPNPKDDKMDDPDEPKGNRTTDDKLVNE